MSMTKPTARELLRDGADALPQYANLLELAPRVAMAVVYCKEDKHPSPERQSLAREILRILNGEEL